MESQIQRIADTAGSLVKSLPVSDLEPKQPNAKKKICKELEVSKLIITLGFVESERYAVTPKVIVIGDTLEEMNSVQMGIEGISGYF